MKKRSGFVSNSSSSSYVVKIKNTYNRTVYSSALIRDKKEDILDAVRHYEKEYDADIMTSLDSLSDIKVESGEYFYFIIKTGENNISNILEFESKPNGIEVAEGIQA